MPIKKAYVTLAIAVILGGCAAQVPLTREQIGHISSDASPADLDALLGQATVSSEYDFQAGGKTYHARHLRLKTGERSEMTMVCGKTCIPINTVIPVTDEYVVVQELPSRKLLGWGTIEELSKNPDERITSIMPALKQAAAHQVAAKS
jgi:hypothetical protein